MTWNIISSSFDSPKCCLHFQKLKSISLLGHVTCSSNGIFIPNISVVVYQRTTRPEGILNGTSTATNKLLMLSMDYVTLQRFHDDVLLYKMYGTIH